MAVFKGWKGYLLLLHPGAQGCISIYSQSHVLTSKGDGRSSTVPPFYLTMSTFHWVDPPQA